MVRTVAVGAMLLAGSIALGGCSAMFADDPNTAHPYLERALIAVQQRDTKTALAQIDQAESIWLGTNTPYGNAFISSDPDALREMARARQSVQMGRWGDAEYYVRTALTHPSTTIPS